MPHRSYIASRGLDPALRDRRRWSLLVSGWVHIVAAVAVVQCPAGAARAPGGPTERLMALELAPELSAGDPLTSGDALAAAADGAAQRADSEATAGAGAAPDAATPAPRAEALPARAKEADSAPDAAPEREEVVADAEVEAPQEAELPEEPPPEAPKAALDYARLSEVGDEAPPDDQAAIIAGRNSRASQPRRIDVTADLDGPQRPEVAGSQAAEAAAARDADPDDPAEKHGGQMVAEEARRANTGGGGGLSGDAAGDGTRGRAGESGPGGQEAPSGTAGAPGATQAAVATPVAAAAGAAHASSSGVAIAPVQSPDWWRPMSSWVGGAPAPEQVAAVEAPKAEAPASVEAPAEREHVAKAERPEEKRDDGGQQRAAEEAARPGDVEHPIEGPEDGPRVGAVDPVEDLRNALGWGGIDREKLKPRQSTVGYVGSEVSAATSAQTALDRELELDSVVWVSARETPLGKYFDTVYPILQERWAAQDLDILDRGLGIQGEAAVVFRIRANGKVDSVVLFRSSGNSMLDSMAVAAIPEKLPKLPRDVGGEAVLHKVTFRYDNPLVVGAGTP